MIINYIHPCTFVVSDYVNGLNPSVHPTTRVYVKSSTCCYLSLRYVDRLLSLWSLNMPSTVHHRLKPTQHMSSLEVWQRNFCSIKAYLLRQYWVAGAAYDSPHTNTCCYISAMIVQDVWSFVHLVPLKFILSHSRSPFKFRCIVRPKSANCQHSNICTSIHRAFLSKITDVFQSAF